MPRFSPTAASSSRPSRRSRCRPSRPRSSACSTARRISATPSPSRSLPPIELADFRRFEIEKAGRRSHRCRNRRSAAKDRRAEPPLCAERRRRQGREGRPRHDLLQGHDRRRGVRRRHGERHAGADSARTPSFRASKTNSSASARARQRTIKVSFPGNYANAALAGKDAEFDTTASPDREAGETSRSTRSSPSRSAWSRSTSSRTPCASASAPNTIRRRGRR